MACVDAVTIGAWCGVTIPRTSEEGAGPNALRHERTCYRRDREPQLPLLTSLAAPDFPCDRGAAPVSTETGKNTTVRSETREDTGAFSAFLPRSSSFNASYKKPIVPGSPFWRLSKERKQCLPRPFYPIVENYVRLLHVYPHYLPLVLTENVRWSPVTARWHLP